MSQPKYYTRLRPFLAAFATGLPILTFHKVGPRPRGSRLRGLYVSRRLFEKQLVELRAAGFQSAKLDDFPQAAEPGSKRLVLTFDDGFENVFKHALEPLAATNFQAIEFVVADRLGGLNDWEMAEGEVPERLMDKAQVEEWLAAGHEIGSHTLTHAFLTRISRAKAQEEIASSKKKLEDLFGKPVRHFCYPYGNHDAAVADLVREAGYATASTTWGGINTRTTPPFELLRITARYRSRSLKSFKEWISQHFA